MNSILSEIFPSYKNSCNNSFRLSSRSEITNPKSSFFSNEQSEILSPNNENKTKQFFRKESLMKDSINKEILLKKFKPFGFFENLKTKSKDNSKVN